MKHTPAQSRRRLELAASALLLFIPSPSAAQWASNGTWVAQRPCCQDGPAICSDGAGGAFISFREYRGGPADVFIQHITADGRIAPGWPIEGLPVCTDPAYQSPHRFSLVADGLGGAIVSWSDDRQGFLVAPDIYALRVSADGQVAPGWTPNGTPVCIAPGDQSAQIMAPDGLGGMYVAWYDQRDWPETFTFVQHVAPDGSPSPGWPANGKALTPAPNQGGVWIVPDGVGGATYAFHAYVGRTVYAMRITPGGDPYPGWPDTGVVLRSNVGPDCWPVMAAPGGTGGMYVTWGDCRTAPPGTPVWDLDYYADVYVQRVTGAGTIPPGWPADGLPVCTLPNTQYDIRCAEDGAGGAFVTWSDYRDYVATIYAVRLTADGTLAPGWPANGLHVSTAPGYQFSPEVVPDGMGGAYITVDANDKLYVQHLTGWGTIAPGWSETGFLMNSIANSAQEQPALLAVGGDAIVAWSDQRGVADGIYAQRLLGDGPVPVQLALAEVDARPDLVTLVWSGRGAAGLVATVERRTEAAPWIALGAPVPDGLDRLRFEDRQVVAGARYAYRLTGADVLTSETWVNVPANLTLALEGFRPNPAKGEPIAAFTLPTAERAALEILDVNGRRVAAREVGSLGPGRHLVRLAAAGTVPAGVYWLRLEQGGRRLVARGVLMR